jgi:catalase
VWIPPKGINAAGKRVWVKYHFKTEQGIQNFTAAEAKAMKAEDPDYHRRDLYQAIKKTDYPVWRLEMQIMPFEDARDRVAQSTGGPIV